MAIQIGKYKRPGTFIEEFDKSVIASPTFQGINNMVIGVSKKGPVNTPILLTNISDLEAIFGQLDRNMERHGSYFHRTVSKMLESTSVYAVNLLLTDDNLDTIEYQSLSAASNKNNDVERTGPYRRFFDTTGFWKRDTESFINLTKNDVGYADRVFNLTNLSDKFVTVFVIKSQLSGFDTTLLNWYGSVEKMPPYVNSSDYASDYMVDVVVIGGDWSDYQALSVDSRFGAYFNASGLRKEQIRNFANDRNVTLLSYYEGLSLIPYFRDVNGRNIFIETSINRDTDKTGLFCAFNSQLFETDFPNGVVDLIGNGLVNSEQVNIDFLSYNEKIVESINLANVILDRPGNVLALGTSSRAALNSRSVGTYNTPTTTGPVLTGNRTGWFADDYVYNLKQNTLDTSTFSSVSIQFGLASADTTSYAIVGGKYVPVVTGVTFSINASSYPTSGVTASYIVAFTIDGTGNIVMTPNYSSTSAPVVGSSDIVLGYLTIPIDSNIIGTSSVSYTPVSVDGSGFVDISATASYSITAVSTGFKVEFQHAIGTFDTSNYVATREQRYFNEMMSVLEVPSLLDMMSIVINPSMEKRSLNGKTVTFVTSTSLKKSFTITGFGSDDISYITNGNLLMYIKDDEFIIGKNNMITSDLAANVNGTASTPDGVVSKNSTFYNDYYTGVINTGDYFWSNLVDPSNIPTSITFVNGENVPSGATSAAGYDYIIFGSTFSLSANDKIIIPSSVSNKGTFTILTNYSDATTLSTTLGYTSSFAYKVNENTVNETLTSVSVIYDYNTKHYLSMYVDSSNNLLVSFRDSLLQSYVPVNVTKNQTMIIQSDTSNYKQTIEVKVPTGYVQVPNKIIMDGSRYTMVKVGDFLEAYYATASLSPGQEPKRLTRIISKRAYSGDPTLTEVTCDARIATYPFGDHYETTRYTTIDDYVSTYKAIPLKGFRIRQASLPDGTETQQNSILNLVAKGTPLFKALTNKEALDFRYLVDSFGLGLTERSKQQLVDICGDRLDAFGFINMPSLRAFKNSSSPSFVDTNGVLQVEFMASGGDPQSNPAFLYSFGDGAGVSATGYFTPYVTVNDNGRPSDVPPAMFVATTYMRKQTSNMSSITPWTIAAGVTNGKVTNIAGLEMDFTPTDIEWLNGAQMNPIVFKRNRGNVIETENTAQTLYKSALSYIHVREVLIELERELSRMLLDFQWKYNTSDIRAEIKLRADVICETYVSKNGLYNYFNKMDEENNTPDIIDNQIGVIDTYVEPIKGMGIIVNNITILRTGAISAGGFING